MTRPIVHRVMKAELMDIYFLKEELLTRRLEEVRTKKPEPWNLNELMIALKRLKNNKTADRNMMIINCLETIREAYSK